ncbi:thiosulfate oxidation carrier protein SoxY [Thiomicrorhabdus sp. 6S2-11]|jgi:sulfur-oxidizing protein SoxY|uniref:Thiosulfate oxidation carrier protein SoxY n=1 Tax=Thiomicrorhabdus marina TaxID=2818442 RepID=A0ABS3Q5W5_9GAMM|nr:thiosulfate oxidation carrier protein SoxY [Thiomicrorhabdus marina]MBO1927746.1 thiosulfate oxidation carrier protein SoxY [Thiomicrorhabdus marina]
MKRRSFLKGTLATGAAAVAVNAGLLTPSTVLAADWNKGAFSAKTTDDALSAVYGSSAATASGDIKLKAPAIAENGAVTPVEVDASGIDGVESISILASKNPMPMVCEYAFAAGAVGFVSTRIKMGETMNVIAIVNAGGKLLKAEQEVKVTIGGCGG